MATTNTTTSTMTYTKPAGLKYTTMCIYVDNTMKKWYAGEKLTEDEEENIYKYIYFLYYNVACRERYFSRFEDYDEYAIWCASKAFLRLLDQRQFTGRLDPIKSILNYMKATSYGWKLKWQAETFQTVFSEKYTQNFDATTFKEMYRSNLRHSKRDSLAEDITEDVKMIPELIDYELQTSPYRADKLMCKRLKQSVLLSLSAESEELKTCKNIDKYAHKYNNIIKLWHLDDSFTGVVRVLLNKVKADVVNNIKNTLRKFDVMTEVTDELLLANVAQKDGEYDD